MIDRRALLRAVTIAPIAAALLRPAGISYLSQADALKDFDRLVGDASREARLHAIKTWRASMEGATEMRSHIHLFLDTAS